MKNNMEHFKLLRTILVLSGLLFSALAFSQTNLLFEAEAAILSGTATIANCNNASGGQMVKNINNGAENALFFQDISIPAEGTYFVTVSYYAVSDPNITWQLNSTAAETIAATASGLWCYQGGTPADITFQESFVTGNNSMLFYNSPIIDKIVISSDTTARQADAFYLSSSTGSDNNDGFSPATAWQTLNKASAHTLVPGDTLLFKADDTFVGKLTILDESGSATQPILVTSYGTGNKPILDGNGHLSTVHLQNSSFIHLSNLEIKNDGGPPQAGSPTNLRYGMYIENTYADGTVFEHYRLSDLVFKNIYPTDQITDNDQTGTHAYALKTSGSWGDEINPTRFDDMLIEDCLFTRTGRHALLATAVNGLEIRNNLFEHVGGAGMVIGRNSSNILVEGNTTNYTGSSIDSRMAGRGSGLWCFRTKNLVVQHNAFMHARGIKDSYGMHIDIGNKNVVYQYNYSEDNEGGFVEILGANVNVGYRYNLSLGDGWRTRGSQLGRIFWIGGWSGNPANPVSSDSVFIYNNSIFVRDTIAPNIWIEEVTEHTRIYNNILYVSNDFGVVSIKNASSLNDFDHNIWYGNIPTTDTDGEFYRGANALTSDPQYSTQTVTDETGFILQSNSPAWYSGKLIYNPAAPDNNFESNGGFDYYGNAVSATLPPNIGAYNDLMVSSSELFELPFNLFPNPVKAGHFLIIEVPSHVDVQSLSLQLIDNSGKIWLEKSYPQQHKFRFETEDLARGCYLIKIRAGNYQRIKKVLVF